MIYESQHKELQEKYKLIEMIRSTTYHNERLYHTNGDTKFRSKISRDDTKPKIDKNGIDQAYYRDSIGVDVTFYTTDFYSSKLYYPIFIHVRNNPNWMREEVELSFFSSEEMIEYIDAKLNTDITGKNDLNVRYCEI